MDEPAPNTFTDADISALKIPPHSIEAEQSVLGALMLSGNSSTGTADSWERVIDLVRAEDFYRSSHRAVFTAMIRLAEENQPLDVITVADALDDTKELAGIGGIAYLGELAGNTPSASNIRAYATIVRDRAILRQLIRSSNTIADLSFFPEGRSSSDVVEEAEREIMAIAEGRPKSGGPEYVDGLLAGALDRIDELYNTEGNLTGVSTGYTDLDNRTAGLQRGDLIIVAGRPSMGKTSFAMNIVEHAAMNEEHPVLVFSMEMSAESLIMRMISSLGKIEQGRVRTGNMQDDDFPKLTAAVQKLKGRPLYIDDTPALSPSEIRSRARRLLREHGKISLIMVDYLQLMQTGSSEGRTAEISEISRGLKGIAKEFDCPLVALSQLNRGLEQRPNRRPVMSDLRESGAIEQDADVIAFIYRDVVYNPDTEDKRVSEIIIGKQRNGPTGTTKLDFFGEYTRFENKAYSNQEEHAPPDSFPG